MSPALTSTTDGCFGGNIQLSFVLARDGSAGFGTGAGALAPVSNCLVKSPLSRFGAAAGAPPGLLGDAGSEAFSN